MRYLKFYLFTILCILLASCNSSNDEISYNYLPVKLAGSESWSIMDVKSGELVYKDEFKNKPSAIYNDVFFIENDNGTYDYYNIKDVKVPINKESFYMASDFVGSDIVAATKPGKTISLINTKCEEVATLDETIVACGNFVDGLASFKDANDKVGFLNTSGKIEIKAKYDGVNNFSDGVAICSIHDGQKDITTYYAVDKSGKELFSFNSKDYTPLSGFSDGYLPVIKDENVFYLDKKGKKVYDLCNKANTYLSFLCCYNDGRSVFCEGESFGLKDKDNKIILRAKYSILYSIGGGNYIARQDGKFGVINYEDKHLIEFKYNNIQPLNDDVLLVELGDSYTLVSLKDEDLTTYNFTDYSLASNHLVKSNYINPKQYALKIFKTFNESSCLGFNGTMTVRDFLSEFDESASNYTYRSYITTTSRDGSNQQCEVEFEGAISRRIYRTEYFYGYSYEIPDGYAFNNNTKIQMIAYKYDITEYGIVEDKIGEEFDNLLKSKGYKDLGGNLFESPKGTVVGLAYEGGKIFIIYAFHKGNLESITRKDREKKSQKTPEGMPINEVDTASVVEEVATIPVELPDSQVVVVDTTTYAW